MGKDGQLKDGAVQYLVDFMQGRNERALKSASIRFVLSHHKKEDAVLLLTESSFYIFRSKGLPKSP
jgi:hypothetical protein